MKNKILIIFGTRPEFLKLYPLIIALKKKKFKFDILNTGQHFELIKDQNFFMKNLKYKNLNLMNKAKNLDELFFIIQKKVSIYLKKKKTRFNCGTGRYHYCGCVSYSSCIQ